MCAGGGGRGGCTQLEEPLAWGVGGEGSAEGCELAAQRPLKQVAEAGRDWGKGLHDLEQLRN